MVYRKGELTWRQIDRRWPHQVAVPAEHTYGPNYVTARLFCEPLSLAPHGHSFRRNDRDYNVWCFAEREHAEMFCDKIGGELIAVKGRPKWPRT